MNRLLRATSQCQVVGSIAIWLNCEAKAVVTVVTLHEEVTGRQKVEDMYKCGVNLNAVLHAQFETSESSRPRGDDFKHTIGRKSRCKYEQYRKYNTSISTCCW